ncbi:hypothetical protein BTN49_1303 [Candidatus Enterovibrio escicola]|uniref:Uncharacterized protein n=1 Tax=Candidatus Enterovibrio escicola TaxID=1927127 RepID=A0A2A5T584_9GAMM|nr:hypothetical protein BTN49_1303 [Candidatus Enterovibrio escacola]
MRFYLLLINHLRRNTGYWEERLSRMEAIKALEKDKLAE